MKEGLEWSRLRDWVICHVALNAYLCFLGRLWVFLCIFMKNFDFFESFCMPSYFHSRMHINLLFLLTFVRLKRRTSVKIVFL